MNVRTINAVGYILLVAAAILFYVYLYDSTHLLILHFDQFRGIDAVGEPKHVLGMIGIAAAIQTLNILLGSAIEKRSLLPGRIGPIGLAYINVILGILILIAVGVIISVN